MGTNNSSKDYGPNCEKPDLSPKEIAEERERILQSYQKQKKSARKLKELHFFKQEVGSGWNSEEKCSQRPTLAEYVDDVPLRAAEIWSRTLFIHVASLMSHRFLMAEIQN